MKRITKLVCRIEAAVLLTLLVSGIVQATPRALATDDSCAEGQYYAQYYDNRNLEGSAYGNQCVSGSRISESWNPWDVNQGTWRFNFSVRWSGRFQFDEGYYDFGAKADDGLRVFVDGIRVIDAWQDQVNNDLRGGIQLYGGIHHVTVEYYQHEGGAHCEVKWDKRLLFSPGMTSCDNVPIPIDRWCAEYYNDTMPGGTPAVVRFEDLAGSGMWKLVKNFDAGGVLPGGVSSQNISVRWRGRFYFDRYHRYRFVASADDGFKVVWDHRIELLNDWATPHPSNIQETVVPFENLDSNDIVPHEITVLWKQYGGAAFVNIGWQDLGMPGAGGGGGTSNGGGNNGGSTYNGSACDGGEGVYLYEHNNFNGRCVKFTEDSPYAPLWPIGNDSASSLKIVGNWSAFLYEHSNYQGHSWGFIQNYPDFSTMVGLNDKVSSILVRRR